MHLIIFLNFLNFGLGIFVLAICFSLYLTNKNRILKYFLYIQLLILLAISNNLIWYYLNVNITGRNTLVLDLSFMVFYVLTIAFSYNFIAFIHLLIRKEQDPRAGRIIKYAVIFLMAVYPALFIYILLKRPGEAYSLNDKYQYMIDFIIILTAFYAVYQAARNYKNTDTLLLKKTVQFLICFILVFIIFKISVYCMAYLKIISFIPDDYQIYHFIWNAMCLAVYFLYVRRHISSSKEADGALSLYKGVKSASLAFAETIAKYERSAIPDAYGKKLFENLESCMKTEKLYLDPELSLQNLSDRLGVTRHHLSQALNRFAKLKFNDYVNGYRVREVISAISDPLQKDKKMTEIAFEAGFNSKSTFNNAFKKATGMNSIDYKNSVKS